MCNVCLGFPPEYGLTENDNLRKRDFDLITNIAFIWCTVDMYYTICCNKAHFYTFDPGMRINMV